MSSNSDTRRIIRPEHFTLAPQLLGVELARPSRRLTALLIDLALVSLLVHAAGGWMLAVAAAYAFFRFSARTAATTGWKRRWVARAVGALILFTVVRNGVNTVTGFGRSLMGDEVAKVAAAGVAGQPAAPATGSATQKDPGLGGAVRLTSSVLALGSAETEEQGRARAAALVSSMRTMGADDEHIRETLEGFVDGSSKPWMRGVVDAAMPPLKRAAAPLPPESLAVRYAAALTARDSAAADSLRPRVASALARDSLRALRSTIQSLRGEVKEAETRAERAESAGLFNRLVALLDDLGIGFGWTGLYFTAFTALWRGQTPGKRLVGVRVLRLDGKPLGFWASFERFGGYAAGLVTGLLGFAQVYWDRNRQAIHDKISETVVVRERTPKATPAPLRSAVQTERRSV
jgi:hypothetical protein